MFAYMVCVLRFKRIYASLKKFYKILIQLQCGDEEDQRRKKKMKIGLQLATKSTRFQKQKSGFLKL